MTVQQNLLSGCLLLASVVSGQDLKPLPSNLQQASGGSFLAGQLDDPSTANLDIDDTEVEKCVPCDGEIDTDLIFDGFSCGDWLEFANNLPADSNECALERLFGWKYCGCPANTLELCTFCEDGGDMQADDLERMLPFSSITCEAFSEIPAIDGEKTCEVARDFNYYCGCPNTEPSCTLCEDGSTPENLDAPLYLGMTCADIHNLYFVSSEERCPQLDTEYPFDVRAYCGCPNVPRPDHACSFCPYDGVLNNRTQKLLSDDTSTCGAWSDLASYAKEGETSCAVFQYVGLECCDDMVLPDFFTEYVEDSAEPQTTSETEPAPSTEAPVPVPNSETQTPVGGTDAPVATTQPPVANTSTPVAATTAPVVTEVLAVSTTVSEPSEPPIDLPFTEPPSEGDLAAAINRCFVAHTEPPNDEVASSQTRSDPQSSGATIPGTSRAANGLSSLYRSSRISKRAESANNNSTSDIIDIEDTDESNLDDMDMLPIETTAHASKWDHILLELRHIALPANFQDLCPTEEFADYTFLPTLPGCLAEAVEKHVDCYLCANGETPTRPSKMIPIVNLYCDEYDTWRSDATSEDCKSLSNWLPFDMAAWCGCPGTEDPPVVKGDSLPSATVLHWGEAEIEEDDGRVSNDEFQTVRCNFCPEGMVLIINSWKTTLNDLTTADFLEGYEMTSTCSQWAEMATYVTTQEGCNMLHSVGQAGCCEEIGENVLTSLGDTTASSEEDTTEEPEAPIVVDTITTGISASSGGATTTPVVVSVGIMLSSIGMLFLPTWTV